MLLTSMVYVLIFIVVAVKTENCNVDPEESAHELQPSARDIPVPGDDLQNFSNPMFQWVHCLVLDVTEKRRLLFPSTTVRRDKVSFVGIASSAKERMDSPAQIHVPTPPAVEG